MRLFAPYRIAFLFIGLPFFTNALEAGNGVVSKEFIAEPPTLISLDFYNNDIINVDDNCIEADGAAHNIRVFRNRCFNDAHCALSTQPVFGGPVYFMRNVVYHVPEGGALKFMYGSSGILVYHSTPIAPARWMLSAVSNLHFRNNLILGCSEVPDCGYRRIVVWSTRT